jgi:hypothetical protein
MSGRGCRSTSTLSTCTLPLRSTGKSHLLASRALAGGRQQGGGLRSRSTGCSCLLMHSYRALPASLAYVRAL